MKSIIRFAIALFLFSACSNTNVKDVQKNVDSLAPFTSSDMNKLEEMGASTEEMTAKTNELIRLAPLNLEQLKALLPEAWYGMKRTAVKTSNAEGYAVAEGNYKKDSNTNIKVMIYDCAGEAGATAYTLTYWGAINAQQESEKNYTRTIDFKDGKAIEEFKKDVNEATLTYVSNGRLLIVLEARNLEPSELKEAAQRLHFKL